MPFCIAYYLVGGAGGDWAVRAGGEEGLRVCEKTRRERREVAFRRNANRSVF
jgi:hypothetical protein